MIPNGSMVKKGDEICRLDSSEIEELTRLEEIQVSQAQASWQQAKLTAETAKIALREYQEGLIKQTTQEFRGRIALGRSDTQRQADRVAWSELMEAKGYLSRSQLLTERQSLAQIQHELRTAEGEFDLFRRFEIPGEIKRLQGQIETAEITQRVEADRLKLEKEQPRLLSQANRELHRACSARRNESCTPSATASGGRSRSSREQGSTRNR